MTTEYGVLSTGFRRPSKTEILNDLLASAVDESTGFGPTVDVTEESVLRRIYATFAERLDVVWQTLEDTFYSRFIPTASGAALTLAAADFGIERTAAAKSSTVVVVVGTAGVAIPAGWRIQADSGVIFVTTEAAVIAANGRVDVAVEAEAAGVTGNVAVNTITTPVALVSGMRTVTNSYDPGTTLQLGINDQGSFGVAADGDSNDYQLVALATIAHPHEIDTITLHVANDQEPTPSTRMFVVHLEVVDHTTGEVLGRTETQTFELTAGEESILTFADEGIDVSVCTGDYLRIVVVNEETSEAVLGVQYDDADQYQMGDFYLNTVQQSGDDLLMTITSVLPGAATGGHDGERDDQLRLRYFLESAIFGNSTAEAIRSQVYNVDGVKSVSVRQNRMDYIVSGMNPHSVEVTVYGGDPDEVAQAIFDSAPAGCETLGSSTVNVMDLAGQEQPVHFNKATKVAVYVTMELNVDGTFIHATGLTAIRDALITYIGGEDSTGTFRDGLLPGDDVVYQKLIGLIMAITGVEDITSLKLGSSANPTGVVNLTIDVDEVAELKSENVGVTIIA